MSYILFDVGANYGSDSIEKTRNNLDIITFAFEPTPRLYEIIKNNTEDIKNRYFVYNYAVSDFIGKAQFNIAGQSDWGCSSLNTFSDNLDVTWPGRSDFKVTEIIDVEVITLKYFIENMCHIEINKIDYLHCDTQGSDLKVLEGAGKYIKIIDSGNIEVPDSEAVKLYKQNHSYEEALRFLELNGFGVYDIGQQQNEKNLYFRKMR
jgi:FkbM family methyltransferase